MSAPERERARSMMFIAAFAGEDAKSLARAAEVHQKTAARWLRQEAEPSASALLRLMTKRRDLAARIMRAVGLDDFSLAAEQAAIDRELARLLAKRAALHGPDDTTSPAMADALRARMAVPGQLGDAPGAPHPMRRATDRAPGLGLTRHEAGAVPATPANPSAGAFLDVSSQTLAPPPADERAGGGVFFGR